MTIDLLLLTLALVLFMLASAGVGHPRINLTALGLAAWVGADLLGRL